MRMAQSVFGWFDHRYRLVPLIEKNVTKKQVPRTLSWAACFGGLSLLTFLVQVFTGVLLLMYYKPHPSAAWDSVTFIKSQVSMGWLVQRIHVVQVHLGEAPGGSVRPKRPPGGLLHVEHGPNHVVDHRGVGRGLEGKGLRDADLLAAPST